MRERHIVYNALQTPDGSILESNHVHDYRGYTDSNGKYYMVDGGHQYIRRSINGDEIDLTVYDDDDFEKVRQVFRWGKNYDAEGNMLDKTEWVRLQDITDDHLDALTLYDKAPTWIRRLFITEKQYRQVVRELF